MERQLSDNYKSLKTSSITLTRYTELSKRIEYDRKLFFVLFWFLVFCFFNELVVRGGNDACLI